MIDKEIIQKCANLARIGLEPGEVAAYTEQLGRVLAYFESLKDLDTEGVEPALYAVEVRGPLRRDEPRAFENSENILHNTAQREDNFFQVPKVIE